MSCEAFSIQSGSLPRSLDYKPNDLGCDGGLRYMAVAVYAPEQQPCRNIRCGKPSLDAANRAGKAVRAVGDADFAAYALLIGLGTPQNHL